MCILLVKKPPKLDKKTRTENWRLINEKLPKLNEEIRRKIDHLFAEGEKPPKPS